MNEGPVRMAYIDYADFPEVYVRRGGAGRGLLFPVKLFILLKYIDLKEPNLKEIFSWNRHGRSFKIHDLKCFRLVILPRFFPRCSYETFRRQLNFWGFKRRTRGLVPLGQLEYGSYYHEKFLRSKDYLCRQIVRKKYSSNGRQSFDSSSSGQEPKADRNPSAEEEPDFSTLKAMPLSEQSRIEKPESDNDLFALLLLKGSNNCNSNHDSCTECSDPSLLAVSSSLNLEQMMSVSNAGGTRLGQYPSNYGGRSNNPNTQSRLDQRDFAYRNIDLPSNDGRSNNPNTQSRLDHRHFAYRNIDLQKILSDENEWQWSHLEPLAIGSQPPPTQDEVEDLQNFMKFVREANWQS